MTRDNSNRLHEVTVNKGSLMQLANADCIPMCVNYFDDLDRQAVRFSFQNLTTACEIVPFIKSEIQIVPFIKSEFQIL